MHGVSSTLPAPDAAGPGVLTFLIADIRGYTAFTRARGDEAAARLAAAFAELAREGVEARGGTVIELRGDEALATFVSPRQALRAAVELQVTFADETARHADLPLHVGIGLDLGEAVPVEGGYRGAALNIAARLCANAKAGEILASESVTSLARGLEGIGFEPREPFVLKGIDDPVRASAVMGLAASEPEAKASPGVAAGMADLPMSLDAVVPTFGRDLETRRLRWAWRQARRGPGRCVVVSGPLGSGKTRLAAEPASLAGRDGARVLYASTVGAAQDVPAAVARAVADGPPCLLVVDDLESASPGDLTALGAAAEAIPAHRVLVLLLLNGDPSDDVARLVGRLSGVDGTIRLGPLDETAMAAIIGTYATDAADPPPVWAIAQASGGMPAQVHALASGWAQGEVARRLGSAVSRAADGRRDLRRLEAEVASNVVDLQLARERLRLIGQADAGDLETCPFKGLVAFDVGDADVFFGRERLVAEMVGRMAGSSFLGVVGPSGSGKSSAIRAGLLPALAAGALPGAETWTRIVVRPGSQPVRELDRMLFAAVPEAARAALSAAGDPLAAAAGLLAPEARPFIVIDQFEELFTTTTDEAERVRFIDLLVSAVRENRATVIVAVRADFYGRCAAYPGLAELLGANHVLVGPMTAEEYRRAIEGPARRAGLHLDPALVDALVVEVIDEPGGLPLLSTALVELWERREGRAIRLSAYAATGGVRGAVGRLAEAAYGRLDEPEQPIARGLFLRLASGEGDAVVRRRVPLSELDATDNEVVATVVRALTEARLLTVGEGTVEVAHEALLREWPRLQGWLEEDRAGRRLREHLIDAAREWATRGRDTGELYRGTRLATAIDWTTDHSLELNETEKAFLAESRRATANEVDRQRRTNRRLRAFLAVASVALVVAVGAGGLAAIQRGEAEQAKTQAEQARTQAEQARGEAEQARGEAEQAAKAADAQRQIAFTRELSASAINNLSVDPERSILLALQAVDLDAQNGQPVLIEAQDALHRSIQASRGVATLRGSTLQVDGITYNHAGTQVASMSDDGTVNIWDVSTNTKLLTLQAGIPSTNATRKISFSPDDTRLATPAGDHTARIWDLSASGKLVLTLAGHTDEVTSVTFSSDGKRVATASGDGSSKVWDAATGKELLTLTGQNESVNDIAFSPDGRYLATAGGDSAAMIWDAASGQALHTLPSNGGVTSVAFSPDGKTLATGGSDATWTLWDVSTGQRIFSAYGHTSIIVAIAFDPTGTRVATASEDGTTRLWDAATARELLTLSGHSSGVLGVAFSPDGVHVATASRDTTVKVWDVSPAGGNEWFNLIGHTSLVWAVAYSPDGKTIATGSFDGTAKLWDANTGKELHTLVGFPDAVQGVAFSPDGARLLTHSVDGTTKIWDVVSGKELLAVPEIVGGIGAAFGPDGTTFTVAVSDALKVFDAATGKELLTLTPGHTTGYWDVAYRPDGKQIAGVGDDANAYVWDAVTGKLLLVLSNERVQVRGIAYSPDGKWIATTSNDATVKTWDAESGKLLHTLAGHTGPTFGVAFSPDGRYLASTSVDGTVKIWNAADDFTSQPLTLYGHTRATFRVAFSPDGARLVTTSRDGTARMYAFKIEDLITLAKSRLTRGLTTEECQKYLHVDVCPASP
jgi:WD40 repeat protein/class 3 adenylate cyclase